MNDGLRVANKETSINILDNNVNIDFPKSNFELKIGNEGGLKINTKLNKTLVNRIKIKIALFFLPCFSIEKWTDDKEIKREEIINKLCE